MRLVLYAVIVAVLVALLFVTFAYVKLFKEGKVKVTKSVAMEIANKEMVKLGYNSKSMKIAIIEKYDTNKDFGL